MPIGGSTPEGQRICADLIEGQGDLRLSRSPVTREVHEDIDALGVEVRAGTFRDLGQRRLVTHRSPVRPIAHEGIVHVNEREDPRR